MPYSYAYVVSYHTPVPYLGEREPADPLLYEIEQGARHVLKDEERHVVAATAATGETRPSPGRTILPVGREGAQAADDVGVEEGQREVGLPLLRQSDVVPGVLVFHVRQPLEPFDRDRRRRRRRIVVVAAAVARVFPCVTAKTIRKKNNTMFFSWSTECQKTGLYVVGSWSCLCVSPPAGPTGKSTLLPVYFGCAWPPNTCRRVAEERHADKD